MPTLRSSLTYLTAARLVVNTAHRFVFPFLPAITRGLGISLEQGGLLLSARSLAFVATPAAVATAGRGERRLRLAAWALGMLAVGALVTAATGVFVGAFVGFILLGLGKPSFDAAAQAYIADRTPYERRARYLAVLELTWAGGLLVGAPAAGWLIDGFGWQAPFWVVGLLLVATLALSPVFLERDVAHPEGKAPPIEFNRSRLGLLAITLLFSFAAENTFVIFGAWLEDSFALSLAALGLASTLIAVAELVGEGSVLVFADRIGKRRMVVAGLIASAAGYALLAPAATSLVAGLAALAFAFVAFEVTIVATIPMASEAAPKARTRYLALLMVMMGIGRAIGDVVGPFVYEAWGVAPVALTSAGAAVAAAILLLAVVEESA